MSEWISNFLRDDHLYYGDNDYDDNYLPDNDPMPGGDADGLYDDAPFDDGILVQGNSNNEWKQGRRCSNTPGNQND